MRAALIVLLIAVAVAAAQAQVIRQAASYTAPQAAICKPGTGIIATGEDAQALKGQIRQSDVNPNGPSATAGRFVGAQTCAPCAVGHVQAETGTFACQPCPEGSWSPVGSAKCFWCPEGSISTGTPTDGCDQCGWGTATGYLSTMVGTSNKWVQSGLAPSKLKNGGSYGQSHTKCFPCPADSYQPDAGKGVCIDCAAGQTTNGQIGQGACVAKAGGGTVVTNKSLLESSADAAPKKSGKVTVKKGKPITKADVKPASAAKTKPKIKKHPRQRYIKSVSVTKRSAATKKKF